MIDSNLRAAACWLLVLTGGARAAGGPMDAPHSTEPRVPVAKHKTAVGLVASEGTFQAFNRVKLNDVIHSRDILVALPGFKSEVEPASQNVRLTLWGNLPELSDSPVLETAVILHDTKAFDLDFTLLRGRIVLRNTREKGAAKVWLRTEEAGVQLTLPEPGDEVALEIYGRWPAGVPFRAKEGGRPVRMWELFVLKGKLDIKAGRNEYHMTAPPGRAYFHGDNIHGPDHEGPQPVKAVPEWADPKAKAPEKAKLIEAVVEAYRGRLKVDEAEAAGKALLAMAAKDADKARATMLRRMMVFAMAALDNVEAVAEALSTSADPEVRGAAVIALRHWIGAREGRDEKLYEVFVGDLKFGKAEASATMQLLHSPFARDQAETYETLIAYLRHRKQAVRELAHWHLVRLAPEGQSIAFDAAGDAESRDKAHAAWRKLIPEGTVPGAGKDDSKKKE
jgi:hypothetical protein